jgi:hypothetical protein
MELPAQLHPARSRLSAKLSELEKAMADLEEYRARAERARVDEDRAMEDEQLSESEAAARISKAQNERNVYASRQAQREKAIVALSSELSKAINAAEGELCGLVSKEVTRRESIISERVVAALQVGNAIDPIYMGRELSDLLHFSGPVQVVRALGPSPMILGAGNNDALAGAAKDVLTKFEKVILEAAKKI